MLLVAAGLGYKLVLAKPSKPVAKHKIDGSVYVLPKEFLVSLAGGRYVKLGVALELPSAEASAGKEGGHGASTPPEGYGSLPQEGVVRSLVTGVLTGTDADQLLSRKGREGVKRRILEAIERKSDVEARAIFFPDLTIQ